MAGIRFGYPFVSEQIQIKFIGATAVALAVDCCLKTFSSLNSLKDLGRP